MSRTVTLILTLALVGTFVAGFWAPPHYYKFWWHHLPGYMIGIGLGGALVFILVGKWIGKHLLQRPEADDER